MKSVTGVSRILVLAFALSCGFVGAARADHWEFVVGGSVSSEGPHYNNGTPPGFSSAQSMAGIAGQGGNGGGYIMGSSAALAYHLSPTSGGGGDAEAYAKATHYISGGYVRVLDAGPPSNPSLSLTHIGAWVSNASAVADPDNSSHSWAAWNNGNRDAAVPNTAGKIAAGYASFSTIIGYDTEYPNPTPQVDYTRTDSTMWQYLWGKENNNGHMGWAVNTGISANIQTVYVTSLYTQLHDSVSIGAGFGNYSLLEAFSSGTGTGVHSGVANFTMTDLIMGGTP